MKALKGHLLKLILMKTSIITFIILACSVSTFAQLTLDTIYANDQKNVALFFSNPIRQGITGADHFIFTYNREKEQYFGLLQAKSGSESNLLTVTSDGKVYSYILRYANKLEKLNYFISDLESIGNEKTGSSHIDQLKMGATTFDSATKNTGASDYPKLCAQLLRNTGTFDQIKYNNGVSVRMTKSIYHANEVYVVFEISNDSQIDFDINTLNLYKVNGIKKRKASYQELTLSPIFRFNMPKIVRKGAIAQFVYVYSKFTLGNHEKLLVKLDELNGNRNVVFRSKK